MNDGRFDDCFSFCCTDEKWFTKHCWQDATKDD